MVSIAAIILHEVSSSLRWHGVSSSAEMSRARAVERPSGDHGARYRTPSGRQPATSCPLSDQEKCSMPLEGWTWR